MEVTEPFTDYEFLRPLVTGWNAKIEAARKSRARWQEVADECMMFYSRSAAAMWDPQYSRKFWQGVKAPKFRITINKAFEMVAVFGPNLLWESPHRTVTPKRRFDFPLEQLMQDPAIAPMLPQMMAMNQQDLAKSKIISGLMEHWLNYTPREQPGGGLLGHSELCVIDALVKGRGVLAIRPYTMPGSSRNLTGSFRIAPEDLFIDPDYKTLHEAKWIAIRHVDPHWAVERRFKLPAGSLQKAATTESNWSYSEQAVHDPSGINRAAGKTNDCVVWYEIYSKTGPGTRLTGMDSPIRDHLEQVVGDYAYIAICPTCPYPLNAPSEALRAGAQDEQVRQMFEWPVPLWTDDRWPIETLDFYQDPDSAWPIPPMAPGLGELKLINFMVPWAANRIWTSSRDFWVVPKGLVDEYRQYIDQGLDQSILPLPVDAQTGVKGIVEILQQPTTNTDVWKIIDMVSEQFAKRTGLTEFAYGRNEDGTQDRTAETTMARARANGVRPEHMQKQVAQWQSRVAGVEAFIARWFVTGQDVEPLLGAAGRMLWENYVQSTDIETTVRQMEFSIGAASIRRPDRDRDVANFQQVMQYFQPPAIQYGFQTGDFTSYNKLVDHWAKFHDADLEDVKLGPLQMQPPMPPQQPGQPPAQPQDPMAQQAMAPPQATLPGLPPEMAAAAPGLMVPQLGAPMPQQAADPLAMLMAQAQPQAPMV